MLIAKLAAVLLTLFGVVQLWRFLRFFRNRYRMHVMSKDLPGPTNYPFIGCAHQVLGTTEYTFSTLLGFFERYPGLSKGWFGPYLCYFVTDPGYLEKLLNHPGAISKPPAIYGPIMPLVSEDGLFLGRAADWRVARKFLSPSFNQKRLNGFVEHFDEQARTLVGVLRDDWDRGEVGDFYNHVSNCTADIVSATLFEYRLRAQERKLSIGTIFDRFFEAWLSQVVDLWYFLQVFFSWSQLYKKKMRANAEINELTEEIFEKKRIDISSDENDANYFEDENTGKFKSLVQNLFGRQAKDPKYSDEKIKKELTTFLLAATDTTSNAMCFILLVLGVHPEIQAKVHEEIEEIMKNRTDRSIKLEDLPSLNYTERVIKETLRLFPPATMISRIFDSDIDLGDGAVIARGAQSLLGFYHLHRDARHWPDPLKFDPDRFLPEETAKRHPYAWLPFAAGPRNCIAYRFAMMMMKVMVAHVVMDFEVFSGYRSMEEVELKMDIIVKPKNGLKISMRPRDSVN